MPRIYTRRPFLERFAEKVSMRGADECWPFASVNAQGYGQIKDDPYASPLRAHRVAWELANGPIPDGLEVCHSCDNPPCVNIVHLHLGTHADNMREMSERNRNSAKNRSACVHGHAYDDRNTIRRNGTRFCRECHNERGRRVRRERRMTS